MNAARSLQMGSPSYCLRGIIPGEHLLAANTRKRHRWSDIALFLHGLGFFRRLPRHRHSRAGARKIRAARLCPPRVVHNKFGEASRPKEGLFEDLFGSTPHAVTFSAHGVSNAVKATRRRGSPHPTPPARWSQRCITRASAMQPGPRADTSSPRPAPRGRGTQARFPLRSSGSDRAGTSTA